MKVWSLLLTLLFHSQLFPQEKVVEGRKPPASFKVQEARTAAVTPAQSLGLISLGDPSQTARMLASEPQVVDPVEVQFDDAGRLWVVEMRDYPVLSNSKPSGRIRILKDRDHDGIFEFASTFADGLNMPTGLYVWKDGVVVTVAGELVFLRDTTGDGKADLREQWLRGFKEDNEQLRANHPRLSLDGWWYIACGLRGGEVMLGKTVVDAKQQESKNTAMQIGSRDIRFRHELGLVEPVTGPAQYGLCFDALGNRYFCSNRNPAVRVILEQEDLVGNPLAGLVSNKTDVIPAGEASRVYPLVNAWTTSNLHAGQFTAACGVFLRPGEDDGEAIEEVYACEPTGSLVKRETGKRELGHLSLLKNQIPEGTEWFASRDPWVRPVNLCLAPNDDMVVVDMHRAVIEHPRWVPEELKNRPDERWGDDSGRVYLVGNGTGTSFGKVLKELQQSPIRSRSTSALVRLVAGDNVWLQKTAARVLLEKESNEAGEALAKAALDPRGNTNGRIACLRLAMTLNASRQVLEGILLNENEPLELRIAAIRLIRSADYQAAYPLQVSLLNTAKDERLLYELLRSLSQSEVASLPPNVFRQLSRTSNPLLAVAAAGAMKSHPGRFLGSWLVMLANSPEEPEYADDFLVDVSSAMTRACIKRGQMQGAVKQKVFGLEPKGGRAFQLALLSSWNAIAEQGKGRWSEELELNERLAEKIAQTTNDIEVKALAARFIGHSRNEAYWPLLKRLARENESSEYERKYLESWFLSGDSAVVRHLLQRLENASPQSSALVVEFALRSEELLDALCRKLIDRQDLPRRLGIAHLRLLKEKANAKQKPIVSSAIDSLTNANRAEVIARYLATVTNRADFENGRKVFRENCASCHRVAGIGTQVGPDISDSRTKSAQQLLTAILDPNQSIDNNYFRLIVLTKNAEVIEGVILDETADSLVLMAKEGKRIVIDRGEIDQLKAPGTSLMPEGYEGQIDPQAMADLISFIKNWRYASGEIPGLAPNK